MHETLLRHRIAIYAPIAGIFAYFLALAGCGSSANTYTAPSTLTKCAVSFDPTTSTVPAAGGSGSVTVQVDRDCQWTASPNAAWLSITSGSSGQGPGTVQFTAAANADPVTRTGALVVNSANVPVTQAAGQCTYQLAQPSASFPQAGGAGSVALQASSPLCQWSAVSGVNWVTVTPASGKGSGSIAFTVSPTTGPPRTGTLSIAGLSFSVTESQGCTYQVAPLSDGIDPSGGTGTATVTTAAGCPWTAAAQNSWITVTGGASGTGPGSVTFTVAASDGASRSGSLTIAGQTFTVAQGQGCAWSIDSTTASVPSAGGSGTVAVTSAAGCAWTAVSNASWITVTAGASGSGNGSVTFTVAGATGPARSGTLTIAGQVFTVNQGPGCTFSLSTGSGAAPGTGATGSFDVLTDDGCSWTATSTADWLAVVTGATGTGNGTVQYSVAPNTGASRTGVITAGGQTFTMTQSGSCAFSIAPTSQTIASTGDTTSVTVTGPAGCSWTATSQAPWITVASGATGSGTGSVQLVVAPDPGAARTGTVMIAGQILTVSQATGCSARVMPTTLGSPAAGGNQNVNVNTTPDCSWTATSNVPWMSISGASSGAGNGTVQLAITPNTGPARSGTATIAAQTVAVNQASGCTIAIAPTSENISQDGGAGMFGVTAAPGCTWAASSDAPWIHLSGPNVGGTGNGSVGFAVDPNSDHHGPRSGTITVAGQVFTVNQAGS